MSESYMEDAPQTYDGPTIPVQVVTPLPAAERIESTQHVSYNNYNIVGQADPIQLLPRNPKRSRAIISIFTVVTTPVLTMHYDKGVVQQGIGFKLGTAQNSVEIKNQRPLYIFAAGVNTSSAVVSVMDESY